MGTKEDRHRPLALQVGVQVALVVVEVALVGQVVVGLAPDVAAGVSKDERADEFVW